MIFVEFKFFGHMIYFVIIILENKSVNCKKQGNDFTSDMFNEWKLLRGDFWIQPPPQI